MAKTLPEEPDRIRVPSRSGAPTTTDPEAIRRAQSAAISADRQIVVPPTQTNAKMPKKEQMTLLCRVDKALGKRIKRIRVEYEISEQAIVSDALEFYFAGRDDSTIVAMLKAKGASLRRIFG